MSMSVNWNCWQKAYKEENIDGKIFVSCDSLQC